MVDIIIEDDICDRINIHYEHKNCLWQISWILYALTTPQLDSHGHSPTIDTNYTSYNIFNTHKILLCG